MKGFTLIELLVSVTIIGILAALASGLFQEYRAKAYDVEAISWVHNLKGASALIYDEMTKIDGSTGIGVGIEHEPDDAAPTFGITPPSLMSEVEFKSITNFTSIPERMAVTFTVSKGNRAGPTTQISIGHCKGTKYYTHSDFNGVITNVESNMDPLRTDLCD